MHVEALANGLGGQSMYLLWLACEKKIPATLSITADTGSENDCLWSTGRRTDAATFWSQVVLPLAREHGIAATFARARDRAGSPMMSLEEHTTQQIEAGKLSNIKIPLFGSNGGRYGQSCTQRWKVQAINQELRRQGAKTARVAQGLHADEFMRRVKGEWIGSDSDGNMVFQTGTRKAGVWVPMKWLTHYYPLVTMRLNREQIRKRLDEVGLPYLVSSECDFCPHKNLQRWRDTSPEKLQEVASIEASMDGQFFFTSRRQPLLTALASMEIDDASKPSLFEDFGCENDVCGI